MASNFVLASLQQLIESDWSNDNVTMQEIVATHAPGSHEVDVKSLLRITEDILKRSTQIVDKVVKGSQVDLVIEDKITHQASFNTINHISCKIGCKALSREDAHATTLSLFDTLARYSWDQKLVLTQAAFALKYGEFWLLTQIYSSNHLAKSMAILKQLPVIVEHFGQLKPMFDELNKVIRGILGVTTCIVRLYELRRQSMYSFQEAPKLSMAHIPPAICWTIRIMLACALQISSLVGMGEEDLIVITEALSTLADKLNNLVEYLQKQLDNFLEEKRNNEAFLSLLDLFQMIHIDNMKILKELIYAKDDIQPLINCSTKTEVKINVLIKKKVLLLISGLDISDDEFSILKMTYTEFKQEEDVSHFEVVWIPIVDGSKKWSHESMSKQFENLKSSMPWYTVHHLTLVNEVVIRFIKKEWHFMNKPILVVLDPKGKVENPNAMHMMWIWGSKAFPFSSEREQELWKQETWKFDLLVDGCTDPPICNWINEDKYIFFYGGYDIKWIRDFTTTASSVAKAAQITIEMVYVGKSSKIEQARKAIKIFPEQRLSQTQSYLFWARLESMFFNPFQLGKGDDRNPMMKEMKKLLSYGKDGEWAVLSKGSSLVIHGHGTNILRALREYNSSKHVSDERFDQSFKIHYDKIRCEQAQPCLHFQFPSHTGRIPENMKCPECLRIMERFITFQCCHDEGPFTFSTLS